MGIMHRVVLQRPQTRPSPAFEDYVRRGRIFHKGQQIPPASAAGGSSSVNQV